jgi:hypothetical protein
MEPIKDISEKYDSNRGNQKSNNQPGPFPIYFDGKV